jgi:hypothetical protein
LEALVSSNDPDEQQKYIFLARWLELFFEQIQTEFKARQDHFRTDSPSPEGNPYMEPDSGINQE